MRKFGGKQTALEAAYQECRPLLWGAFGFGLFINLLMVAVPIYSLQVLDHVLSSGSYETLAWLTFVVGGAIVFMGILQGLRSLVFTVSVWCNRAFVEVVSQLRCFISVTPRHEFVQAGDFVSLIRACWCVR